MDASLSAQSALICFASCSDDDIATALRTRTDLRNRLHDLIAVSFQDPADTSQTASASANWPDSHHPATPAPHAVFGGKPTSQSNKGAGKKSTSSQGKGPSDYAPQSRPRPSWHDMSHDPQAQDSNWDQTHYTAPRQQEHDPWQQASNPHRNAYREPWPPGSPLAQHPDWNAPQAQQSRSPPASDQGGKDLPLVPSNHIAPHLIEWCGTRPYFKNRRNNWACAYACTRTACRHGRPACNFTPYDVQTDMHFPHACSLCKADDNAGKGK